MEKLEPRTLLVGMWNGAAAVKKVWQFLKKLNIELPYDLAVPLLGLYPRELKTGIQTKTCTWGLP